MRTEIVPATAEMLERCGGVPAKTVRAVAAVRGAEVIGVAGVYSSEAGWVMFADLTDELRADKRAIVRGIRAVLELVRRRRMVVVALADPEIRGSATLLEHIGFRRALGDAFLYEAESV